MSNASYLISDRSADVPLATFRPVSADEVAALINKSPAKQCPLDPLPTWLLKDICDTISPVIAIMCNASISHNKFPQSQKSAIVRPLLKKTTLDPFDLNSFRPISNLSFVSKLLERIIDIRFTQHADQCQYNLFSLVQSAYRKFHSTETALVKIHNDLITTIDEGHVGALALLDLSAAFDTVDHQLLLEILRHCFCVTDSALAWFASYLSDRSQVVHINNTSSDVF